MNDKRKANELWQKAQEIRRKAGVNRAYNPKHSTRIKAMMIGRAEKLEAKALLMLAADAGL